MANEKKPAAKPDAAKAAQVECVVLHDCIYGKHDDIITLGDAEAKAAYAAGYVDTHPNALRAIREAKKA